MAIECYNSKCPSHDEEGPFCHEPVCIESVPPLCPFCAGLKSFGDTGNQSVAVS